MAEEQLTIGELAERIGRRPSAIRYYEEVGLLPEPIRVSGRRRYGPEALRAFAVIDTAQAAGLSLDEIKALLHAEAGDGAAVEELRRIATRRLPEVNATIERAVLVKRWLEVAARCECPSLDDCALFESAARSTD